MMEAYITPEGELKVVAKTAEEARQLEKFAMAGHPVGFYHAASGFSTDSGRLLLAVDGEKSEP